MAEPRPVISRPTGYSHSPVAPSHTVKHTDGMVRGAGPSRADGPTLAIRAGVHPWVVQERLGHSTIAVTLQTYSHAAPVMHEEAAELVAGLFRPT